MVTVYKKILQYMHLGNSYMIISGINHDKNSIISIELGYFSDL